MSEINENDPLAELHSKLDEYFNAMGAEKVEEFTADAAWVETVFEEVGQRFAVYAVLCDGQNVGPIIDSDVLAGVIYSSFLTGISIYRQWLMDNREVDILKLEGRK